LLQHQKTHRRPERLLGELTTAAAPTRNPPFGLDALKKRPPVMKPWSSVLVQAKSAKVIPFAAA
jgi:hypothetical protein